MLPVYNTKHKIDSEIKQDNTVALKQLDKSHEVRSLTLILVETLTNCWLQDRLFQKDQLKRAWAYTEDYYPRRRSYYHTACATISPSPLGSSQCDTFRQPFRYVRPVFVAGFR